MNSTVGLRAANRTRRKWQQVVSVLAGMVCTLVVLEGGLRVLGVLGMVHMPRGAGVADASWTLLCVGDSYTYGAGAPPAASYPAQLEKLLRARSTGDVTVINAGLPAANTAQLLQNLPGLLARHKPRAVLVLAGGANGWNFWGYRAGHERSPRAHVWYRIRVFKLAKLLLRAANDQRRISRRAHLEQVRYEAEYQRFVRAHAANSNDAQPYYEMGAFYLREKDCEEAARWFREGIARNPANQSNYFGLGNALELLGRAEEALAWWKRGCRGERGDALLLELIGRQHVAHGRHAEALAALEEAAIRDPAYAETRVTLSVLSRVATGLGARISAVLSKLPPGEAQRRELPDLIMPAEMERAARPARAALLDWVARDLEAMRAVCAEHGAALVVLNYPLRHFHTQTDGPVEIENFYNAVNELLAAFAERHGLGFVDNRSVFERLYGRKLRFFYLEGGDEHPNAAGYGLMASNVYAALSSCGLTP